MQVIYKEVLILLAFLDAPVAQLERLLVCT